MIIFFILANISNAKAISALRNRFLGVVLVALLLYQPIVFTLLYDFWFYFCPVNETKTSDKSFSGLWSLKEGRMVDPRKQAGREYKMMINATNDNLFKKIKFYGVPVAPRDRDEPSRGSEKLRVLIQHMKSFGRPLKGTFVDLCAGAGGWSYVMDSFGMKGTAISFWKQHPAHAQWAGPSSVKTIQGDIGLLKPFRADWILCDGGEAQGNYDKEEQRHANLLNKVIKWLECNPSADFVIKVLSPTGKSVQAALLRIQQLTGKGKLVRLDISRLSTSEMYLVSTEKGDVFSDAYNCVREIIVRWRTAMDNPPDHVVFTHKVKEPQWEKVHDFPDLDPLEPFDYTESINQFAKSHKVHKPRNVTGFLKEICYFYSLARGSSGGPESQLIKALLAPLQYAIEGLSSWKSTSTTPEATFRMVLEKVDKPPKEEHQHWDLIRSAYRVLGDFMLEKGLRLRLQTNEEVYHASNPQGTMSQQEATIFHRGHEYKFPSIKEYADARVKGKKKKYIWAERLKDLLKSFQDGKPLLSVFETTGKKEKKQDFTRFKDKGSRLIWFLPATLRLFEQMVFGGLEGILAKVPFTVSGRPLYDYGEMLADIFVSGTAAVADDIAGWDTRISKGIQILECHLLCRLAKTREHKQYITWLYRLYSNACLAIDRMYPGEREAETAIFLCQGQVASGRRPTYAMNTLTNLILTMVSVGKSRGMNDAEILNWIRRKLRCGQTPDFSALVSGDDKVVVMEEEKVRTFAAKAHHFMNEIGLIRKDMQLDEDSKILTEIEDVEFCSNNYVRVSYHIGDEVVKRWMPIRGAHEIFGKAQLLLTKCKDEMTEMAWAKMQGLNLFVNYHHIPEVRALALTILSVVDTHVNLQGLSLGWTYQSKPWIQDGDALEILSKCLFGESTTIHRLKLNTPIRSVRSLGQVSQQMRKRYCGLKSKDRKAWYMHLGKSIHDMRNHFGTYDNWYHNMDPLNLVAARQL